MKLTSPTLPFEIEDKRFYLRGTKLEGECPNCHKPYVRDFGSDPALSYPDANTPFENTQYCPECEHEWPVRLLLTVQLSIAEKDTIPAPPSIDEVIRNALIERGWKIDETAVENRGGELHEFIDPDTGRRLAWLDALLRQGEREVR